MKDNRKKPVYRPAPKVAAVKAKPKESQPLFVEIPKLELNQPYFNKWIQAGFLSILAVILYYTTCWGGYALDDLIVITGNKFTQLGFGGIKNLLFKDSFLGYTGMENQLAGGRYRPLSIVTFAIEYEFMGKDPKLKEMLPHFSHTVNVIMYGILAWQLFFFLDKWVFKKSQFGAFLTTLLFIAHPIHTEIVANIKSRDELMALSFVLLSMDHYFKHFLEGKSKWWMVSGMFFFFLSLISKENGLVYFGIVPLFVYVFHNKTKAEAFKSGIPYFLMIVFYLIFRFKLTGLNSDVVNGEILNAPYIRASASQAFATKVMLLGKFLYMLIIPYPMSYDYSFNEIKYTTPADPRFLLSFLVNAAILFFAVTRVWKRNVLAFCFLFYYAGISLVSNFFFNIGTAFADRFLFQPSLGWAIAIGYYTERWVFAQKEVGYQKKFAIVCIAMVAWAIPSVAYTIHRSDDWLSEYNLFSRDVVTCPGSAKTHSNCGVVLINKSAEAKDPKEKLRLLNEAVDHLNKSLAIHPQFMDAIANLGVAYSRLEKVEDAERVWMEGYRISPQHPKIIECVRVLGDMFFFRGFQLNQQKKFNESAIAYQKSIIYHYRDSAESYYNWGGNLLMTGNLQGAKAAWTRAVQIKPDHQMAKQWLNTVANLKTPPVVVAK